MHPSTELNAVNPASAGVLLESLACAHKLEPLVLLSCNAAWKAGTRSGFVTTHKRLCPVGGAKRDSADNMVVRLSSRVILHDLPAHAVANSNDPNPFVWCFVEGAAAISPTSQAREDSASFARVQDSKPSGDLGSASYNIA